MNPISYSLISLTAEEVKRIKELCLRMRTKCISVPLELNIPGEHNENEIIDHGSFTVNRKTAVELFNKLHVILQDKTWLDEPERRCVVEFKSA